MNIPNFHQGKIIEKIYIFSQFLLIIFWKIGLFFSIIGILPLDDMQDLSHKSNQKKSYDMNDLRNALRKTNLFGS